MSTQLLEIQPKELKFLFELKKQSSCSIRLTNLTDNYVAFKVKTTSPKKYCVRPNVGVVLPNSTSEFSVMMQAPRTSMTDMDCKDKFLIQSTIVSSATTDEDITSSMFSKDGGKYVEEKKLRVTLVSPPNSPMLSPMKVDLKQGLGHEHSFLKDQFGGVEIPPPQNKVTNDVKFTATSEKPNPSTKTELKPSKDVELKPEKDVELKPEKDFELKSTKDVELKPAKYEALEPEKDMEVKPEKEAELKPKKEAELKPVIDVELISAKDVELKPPKAMEFKLAKDVELNATKIVEDLELVKDIQEMKSKLNALELKLSQAEVTILKLTEERSSSIQETRIMQEQLVHFSHPFLFYILATLFVCLVMNPQKSELSGRVVITRGRLALDNPLSNDLSSNVLNCFSSFISGTTESKRCGCENSPCRISSPICLYGGDHQCCFRILSTPLKNMCMKLEQSTAVR